MANIHPIMNDHNISRYKVIPDAGMIRLKKARGDDVGPATIDIEIAEIKEIVEILKGKGLL